MAVHFSINLKKPHVITTLILAILLENKWYNIMMSVFGFHSLHTSIIEISNGQSLPTSLLHPMVITKEAPNGSDNRHILNATKFEH